MAKAGKTLQELAAELQRQADARKDFIAPQGKVEARAVEGDIVLDGINGGMTILPHAHKQLGEALEIPAKYYERMRREQPALLAENVNTWFRSEPDAKRMIRTLDGKVRAVLSPKYRALDNFELAHAVLPKLFALNVNVVSCEITETRMYIKAILPELCDDLPEGMVWGSGHNQIAEYRGNTPGKICAAITIRNSEVGNGALSIDPSVFSTWCTNLAVIKAASMRKYHVGRSTDALENFEIFRDSTREADDRAFFLKVADITDAAFRPEIFRAAVAQIRATTEVKIENTTDLPKVVEATVRHLALPQGTSNTILTYLAQGGDFSQWGLSSAVTATANVQADYELATTLERAGGELLAMPARDFRALSAAA